MRFSSSSLSFKEQIGQHFIIGFDGTSLTDDIKKLFRKFPFGGVILFRNNLDNPLNINELKSFTNDIQNLSKNIPIFISIDQEGGLVKRLDSPVTQFPGNSYLGSMYNKTTNPTYAYNQASVMAKELSALGFNLNFSPVVDIDTNPKNPIIGQRAYSSDAHIVKTLASATITAYNEHNLLGCYKHFPGHGATEVDSHLELPILHHTLADLYDTELIPYSQMIDISPPTIMSAHILFPNIDPINPATLSKTLMTDLLRTKLHYNGVLISDDMNMNAISAKYSPEDWVIQGCNAGIDCFIVGKNLDIQMRAFETLLTAAEKNTISNEMRQKSLHRILTIKEKIVITQNLDFSLIGCDSHQAVSEEISNFSLSSS